METYRYENWWRCILQTSRTFLNPKIRNQTTGKPKFKGQQFRVNPKIVNDYYFFTVTIVIFGSRGEIYTVFVGESESEVENLGILHPDLEIKDFKVLYPKTSKTRISLFNWKIPYFPFLGPPSQ